MILVAAAAAFLLGPHKTSRSSRTILAVVVFLPLGYLAVTRAVEGVLGQRSQNASDLAIADGTRIDVANGALNRLLSSPLFGDTFIPSTHFTAGGKLTAQPILYPSHNQYLDVGLRAGVAAIIIVLGILVVFMRNALAEVKHGSRDSAVFHAGLFAILIATIAGNFTQLYMVQTWTGGLLFALLGVSSAVGRTSRGEVQAQRLLGIVEDVQTICVRQGAKSG